MIFGTHPQRVLESAQEQEQEYSLGFLININYSLVNPETRTVVLDLGALQDAACAEAGIQQGPPPVPKPGLGDFILYYAVVYCCCGLRPESLRGKSQLK